MLVRELGGRRIHTTQGVRQRATCQLTELDKPSGILGWRWSVVLPAVQRREVKTFLLSNRFIMGTYF